MSDIRIIPVTTKKGLRTFIQFYYDLYEGSKYAVPYLRFDEWNTLSKDKNPAFDFCEAQYFLAIDYSIPKVVGRIAAIINHCANDQWNKKQVRFGWFDFIDNLEVSGMLLDAAAHWGRERGMEELVGPLGFTDMDREGMLIEGFHEKSTMYVNYNYPYYPKHMDALELFQKDNDWLEYRIKVPEVTPPKFAKTAQLIESRYNLHVHKFTKHELVQGGMGREVFRIVNETYKDLYDFQQLTDRLVDPSDAGDGGGARNDADLLGAVAGVVRLPQRIAAPPAAHVLVDDRDEVDRLAGGLALVEEERDVGGVQLVQALVGDG